MRYGVVLPNVEAGLLAELAPAAEAAGWEGVFVWDTISGPNAWVALTAAAMRTERVRLGTMLTPLSRRRPWTLAGEVASLDRLSGGRVILPVGLGATGAGHANDEFVKVGEETDRGRRAELLDESLAILDGLWSGQPFSYDGAHYHLRAATLSPTPMQAPRVPIWVVGAWPRMKSMRRALRCDGILPTKMPVGAPAGEMTPADIRVMRAFIVEQRAASGRTGPYDIVIEGETPGDDPTEAAAIVRPWATAGATWWLESIWRTPESFGGVEGMRERIRQGPPRLDA